jgi:hypothetical protein
MTKCSIIILSWTRPDNIKKIISEYEKYFIIDEIIIWNNNKNYFLSNIGKEKVKTINCNQDFGLNTRFLTCLLAKNRCVIVHDDDLLLSEKNVSNFVENFEKDYTRVYTYEGRIPQNNQYTYVAGPGVVQWVDAPTEVPITLTRSVCFDKMWAVEYMKLCDVVFYDSDINLNGEDIAFSYIVSHLSGRKPLVLPVPDREGWTELPADYGGKISARPNFLERRTEIYQRCEILLPQPQYPSIGSDKIVFFGNGHYPFAYCNDSVTINSNFKKILVKEFNGIKTLYIDIPDNKTFAILSILCNIKINPDYILELNYFYSEEPSPTEIQINCDINGENINSKRIYLNENNQQFYSFKAKISDFFDSIENNILLKEIYLIYHNSKNQKQEIHITDIGLIKPPPITTI